VNRAGPSIPFIIALCVVVLLVVAGLWKLVRLLRHRFVTHARYRRNDSTQ
jgi:flagellar biogenesis protein FliO